MKKARQIMQNESNEIQFLKNFKTFLKKWIFSDHIIILSNDSNHGFSTEVVLLTVINALLNCDG